MVRSVLPPSEECSSLVIAEQQVRQDYGEAPSNLLPRVSTIPVNIVELVQLSLSSLVLT